MKLTVNEEKLRNLYLQSLAKGEIQGPMVGVPSIDKPWLKYYKKEAITSKLYNIMAYELLYENNKNHENDIALNYFDKKITYKELFEHIDYLAKCYQAMGVKSGDIVSLCMPTLPETIYSIYALNKLGAVSNMIDLRTSSKGIKEYLNEVHSKLVVCFDMCVGEMNQIIKDTDVEKIVTLGPVESLPAPIRAGYKLKSMKDPESQVKISKDNKSKFMTWSKFMKLGKNEQEINAQEYKENLPAVIVHTSGTTSKPKAIVLSNDNLNAMVLQHEISELDIERQQIFLNIVPPFVAYGLVNSMHMPLCLGMHNVLIPKVVNDDFPDLMLKYRPNHVLGIPMHWEILMQSPKMNGVDLSHLKNIVCGGDVLGSNLEKRINSFLKDHNCSHKISKGYGMTEMSSAATFSKDECNETGSVGIPFAKNTLGIFKPNTEEELHYGEQGEICVVSPTTMIEYYNNPEETDKILKIHKDGKTWVHTGDLGHVTQDGLLYVDGRIKRMIIRRGFKISPASIENVLLSHPAVENCVVVGTDDLYDGHVPTACIVLKDGYSTKESQIKEELNSLCLAKLPDYYCPAEYVFRSNIPVTNVGKVDFKKLTLEENERKETKKSKVKLLKY